MLSGTEMHLQLNSRLYANFRSLNVLLFDKIPAYCSMICRLKVINKNTVKPVLNYYSLNKLSGPCGQVTAQCSSK